MSSSGEAYQDIISGRRRGPVATGLRGLLRLLSVPYGGVTATRNLCFDHGLRSVTHADVPVISVGNLTTGGTGKTPVVATIVRMLQQLDCRPGIVSRGYRSDSSGTNDELRVLEHLCPQVPHVQNPDRVAAAAEIIADHHVDSIVLDDGFQHRRIGRCLDVVLIDATNPFGFDSVLPRGLLRESARGLRRADQVIITRCDQVSESCLAEIESRIGRLAPRHQNRILRLRFRPTALLSPSRDVRPLTQAEGARVMILTAIGNPQGFVETCRQAGAQIVRTRFYPDHYHYASSDLASALSEAEEHQADLVLTTVKDLVKFSLPNQDADSGITVPVAAVEIAAEFPVVAHEEQLRTAIGQALPRTPQDQGAT